MKLKAVERELIEPGWKQAFQHENIPPEGKGTLAALEIGERVRPKKVRAERRRGLSEAGLIRALREKGIGRPATYALIVESLLGRKYIQRAENGQLVLTQRGRAVCAFLTERFPALFDLGYTAAMESALDGVAKEKVFYEDAIQKLWGNLKAE